MLTMLILKCHTSFNPANSLYEKQLLGKESKVVFLKWQRKTLTSYMKCKESAPSFFTVIKEDCRMTVQVIEDYLLSAFSTAISGMVLADIGD